MLWAGYVHRATGLTISRFTRLGSYPGQVLLIAVLLVAAILRLYHLDTIPSGLSFDESVNGVDALKILNGERPIFLIENSGREVLFMYLQALSLSFLGQSDFALRIVPAFIGILTVVAAFPLIRRMFDLRIALLACGWFSTSLWHVLFSRVGLRSIALPLFLAVGFYCLWRGFEGASTQVETKHSLDPLETTKRSKPAIWFALGGIAIGLSLYTYTPARFAPLFVLAFALYIALLHRRLLRHALPGLALSFALIMLVSLPLGLFFLSHPDSFLERIQEVWVFNQELSAGRSGEALFDSALRTLGMFAVRGDVYWHSSISGRPLFDPLSALLLLMGLALTVRRFQQPAYGFILIWLVVMFIPSLLAVQGTPSPIRATALIPAVFILPALGTMWLWDTWDSRIPRRQSILQAFLRKLPLLLIALAFLSGAFYTYYSYFELWAKSPGLWRSFDAGIFPPLSIAETVTEGLELARTENRPIFLAVGDFDNLQMLVPRINLAGKPEAKLIRTFEPKRSLIFPIDRVNARYLIPSDVDPIDVPAARRYLEPESVPIVGPAPSARPIKSFRLLDPRPPFAPEWPVSARFGDDLFVYGFDMPTDVRAGETVTVQWYWRLLAKNRRNLTFTNQLYGRDGDRRAQLDDRGFAPDYWPVGTTGITSFEIRIDPEAPTGAYWMHAAIYTLPDERSQDSSNLPIFDALGNDSGQHLSLGPIKVHGRPPAEGAEGLVSNPSAPKTVQLTRFADQIDLLGYSLNTNRLVPGKSLELILLWSPRGRPSRDYTIFVHLLDSAGQIRGQTDSPPASGRYPTSVWDAGEMIADSRNIPLAPDLPAGEYRMTIGLYDPETGQRIQTVDETGKMTGDSMTIFGLIVGNE